jgi:hypothetical protein
MTLSCMENGRTTVRFWEVGNIRGSDIFVLLQSVLGYGCGIFRHILEAIVGAECVLRRRERAYFL